MSFNRILVLGARGQVGSALLRQEWPVGTFVLPTTRDHLELTDPQAVWAYLMRWRPQVVVNAAAYTAVDAAEAEPEAAAAVNHQAVVSIVQGVRAIGARLIHLSTDYVFDGQQGERYREGDPTGPVNVYGRSKLAGEQAALELDDALVIRTSGVFSATGHNFVKTIRELGRTRDRLEVVDDQRLCPTSADDLAGAIAVAIRRGLRHTGVFHVAAPDDGTWWDIADEVLRLDGRRDQVTLRRISSERSDRPAPRPPDSRLSSDAFAAAYDLTLGSWRESLKAVCGQLDRRDRPDPHWSTTPTWYGAPSSEPSGDQQGSDRLVPVPEPG